MELFKHNEDTLYELLRKLEHNSRVGVVQCTGSGKGCIAAELITKIYKDKRILLLAPQEAILTNYLMSLGIKSTNRVQLATYQGVCRRSEDELLGLGKFADILILDEYHRCGAEKWGKAVNKLIEGIESHEGKTIGFSATPTRFLDDERDMSEELFKGVIVEGLDLTSAIKKGIIPTFTYIKARYGYIKDIREYEKLCKLNKVKSKINPEKLALIKDNGDYIFNIIKKETQEVKGCQKWVVFCSGIDDLIDLQEHIPKWFNAAVTKYSMHSKMGSEQSISNLLAFQNSTKGINILSVVNKLNEGVHVKGITGVIMLRQTVSPIIFMQQLGRALSVGSDTRPIIFDFVGNIETIQNYESLIIKDMEILADEVNTYAVRREKKNKSKGGKIILKSYCEEIDKVLHEINKVIGWKWSAEEDAILKQYFLEEKKDIVARLPARNWDSIYQRARGLGLVATRDDWTRGEDNIIRNYYPIEGVGVTVRLTKSDRTEGAIKARAIKLGVKRDKLCCWSELDDDLLKRKYKNGKYSIEDMHRLLGAKFTTEQIYKRLQYLGFDIASTARWTSDEDAFLRLMWGNMPIEEIEKKLIRHTKDAIDREASYLGLEKKESPRKKGNNQGDGWSESDIEGLIELYNLYGKACFTLFEPRTIRAVEQEITKLRKDIRYKDRLKSM